MVKMRFTKKEVAFVEKYIAENGEIQNIRQLASLVAKLEGKKTQAKIGEVREILKIFYSLCILNEEQVIFSHEFE